jgi:hypothetical protein
LALLVTHSNFQNCYLLLAIGVAGASACALSGHWRRSILILGIGAVSAVSLLVYIPTIRGYGDATTIQFVGSDFWTMLANCVKAIGCENAVLLWTWAALLLVAIVWSFRIYFQQRRSCPGEPSLHLFIALAILAAVGGGLLFFRGMNLYVNPWHVAPLIAFLAVLVECGLTQPSGTWISTCKAAIACLVTAVSLLPAWQTAQVRRTTLDLVCQALDREASPEDLVLVNPFYLSPGFNYHYHGRAPWSTLPIIPDDESVRMFPAHGIIHVMTAPHAIEPTQARIRETLSKGRRVWLVGGIQLLPANTRPPDLPPAPQSEFGWNSNPYAQVWSMQAGYFVQTHALRGRPVDLPVDGPINRLENIPLIWIEGWKD